MPTYEMPLMIRIMTKPELITSLKRTAETIFNGGGFIRKIENWGVKQLPCKTKAHGHTYREANHFLLRFELPSTELHKVKDQYNRDVDIVRLRIFKHNEPNKEKCTFHEEMLPPPYRSSIQKLMDIAKKQDNNKNKFKYNTGLDYYPFNK